MGINVKSFLVLLLIFCLAVSLFVYIVRYDIAETEIKRQQQTIDSLKEFIRTHNKDVEVY